MTADEMRADLRAHGWREERPDVWRSPHGSCFRFPGAWRRMDYARRRLVDVWPPAGEE